MPRQQGGGVRGILGGVAKLGGPQKGRTAPRRASGDLSAQPARTANTFSGAFRQTSLEVAMVDPAPRPGGDIAPRRAGTETGDLARPPTPLPHGPAALQSISHLWPGLSRRSRASSATRDCGSNTHGRYQSAGASPPAGLRQISMPAAPKGRRDPKPRGPDWPNHGVNVMVLPPKLIDVGTTRRWSVPRRPNSIAKASGRHYYRSIQETVSELIGNIGP